MDIGYNKYKLKFLIADCQPRQDKRIDFKLIFKINQGNYRRFKMSNTNSQLSAKVTFVFGALRSGTTVLRLMLFSHEKISNPGEVDFLFDFISRDPSHPSGWRYNLESLRNNRIFRSSLLEIPEDCDGLDLLEQFINQLESKNEGLLTLNVHRNINKIVETVPHAQFIHLLRDPRDVARSSIGMGWVGTVYYGVDHWIGTEQAWDMAARNLDAPQVYDMHYEALFLDVEKELRKVCAFLELPYSASMLDYHKTTTYGPPDKKLVEQWRHKLSQHEIGLVEGKAGDMMKARHYELFGKGIVPGYVEKVNLFVSNKVFIWRHGIKRFGFMNYVSEKLTRWLGMSKRHAKIKREMDAITVKHLK